jgi:phenylacetate-CoA ligase
MRQVMRDARLSRPELEVLVLERLRAVLTSAYLHVPYYRELMASVGYNPVEAYNGPRDLRKLPVTTRTMLSQAGMPNRVNEGADLSRCFATRTSGSTGIPLDNYISPWEKAVKVAKWLRVLFANGYSIRDRTLAFQSAHRIGQDTSVLQKLGLLRRHTISFQQPAADIADAFLDYSPDLFYGYRSIVDQVALELRRRGAAAQNLKLLVVTADVIPESSRKLCRDAFGQPLTESYGSEEMGVMAYETPARDGLHLCDDLTYFEFLDDAGRPVGPGEAGRVVVTDLLGEVTPFIRYDQGDLAIHENVNSGRSDSSRRITGIVGRDDDYVTLPDGSRRTRFDFADVSWCEAVLQWRVVQKTLNRIEVSVVTDAPDFESVRSHLLGRLQRLFPPGVEFEILREERLEPDPSGKRRLLISEVAPRSE